MLSGDKKAGTLQKLPQNPFKSMFTPGVGASTSFLQDKSAFPSADMFPGANMFSKASATVSVPPATSPPPSVGQPMPTVPAFPSNFTKTLSFPDTGVNMIQKTNPTVPTVPTQRIVPVAATERVLNEEQRPLLIKEINAMKQKVMRDFQSLEKEMLEVKKELSRQLVMSEELISNQNTRRIDAIYSKSVRDLSGLLEAQERLIAVLQKGDKEEGDLQDLMGLLEQKIANLLTEDKLLGQLVITDQCFDRIESALAQLEKQ